jgi:uncharacterized protein DUF1707/uncharacterized protein DUF4333
MSMPGNEFRSFVRANDVDRSLVCGTLDAAYADGELDGAEHASRITAAMAAKTRGELQDLVSDLQLPIPAVAQPAVPAVPRRRARTVGVVVGGGLIVLAAMGAVALFVNHSPTPATNQPVPTTAANSPSSQPVPTSTAEYWVSRDVLMADVMDDYRKDTGHPPTRVDCPEDVPGEVGAVVSCTLEDNGVDHRVTATVTAASGAKISYHIYINGMQP